jgi:opacity protein-like surface antigen
MKLIQLIALTILLTGSGLPLMVHAGAESGVYIGAGVGNSNIKGTVNENDFDTDATGYKLILGYNIGVVPLIDLAIEGSYVDMGEESLGDIEYSQTSFNGFGLAGMSFGPIGLFAKAGLAAWDADTNIGGLKASDSGSDPVYGIGARIHILSVTGRIEYEYYDQGNFDDVSMTSLSLLYTF